MTEDYMNIEEIITAKNVATDGAFGTDFAGYYDISATEAERIAARATSLDDFEAIWENENWWQDEAHQVTPGNDGKIIVA